MQEYELMTEMSEKNCPVCGKSVPRDASFCLYCGARLNDSSAQVNTHSYGWLIMSFLVSFLWFRINGASVFPLGFIGGLLITFWSSDIDKSLGKKPLTGLSVLLSLTGMILGLLINR
jgi:predicted nucleic acid-binding Zn ribbon protein